MMSSFSALAIRRSVVGGVRAMRLPNMPLMRGLATVTGQKSDVIFSPTSSAELDSVFTNILHKIVLPMRLPADQRKYIFKEQYSQRLQTDPIIIEVDGYEHRFETIDFRNKDMPSSRALFLEAVRLMKTPEDWDNLIRLLSGYTRSNRTIKLKDRFRVVREAGKTGNIWAIIEALRNSEKSTLYIRHLPTIDELMHWLTDKAVSSEYSRKQTLQAATWGTIVMDLLERPEHRRDAKTADASKRPLHREPQVLAQYLMLLSAESVYHNGATDPSGAITKTAKILVQEWTVGKSLLELNPLPAGVINRSSWKQRANIDYSVDYYLHYSATRRISIASTVVKAVELAKQVVSPELGSQLDGVAEGAKKDLDDMLAQKQEGRDKRGWKVYEALLGENQVQPKAEVQPVVEELKEGETESKEVKPQDGE